MFKEIFLFDLKQNFGKPSTYIFFGIFFLLTLILGLSVAGVFDVATGDSNIIGNSAHAVSGIIVGLNDNILGLVNSVILVAIMATAIQKDYEYNIHPLIYTKPITKEGYFFGRFFSAFLTAVFVFSAQVIGYYVGCLFGMDTPRMGTFTLMNYLQPFLIFSVPNILLLGIIFFSVTTFTRNTLPAYLFCIVLLVVRTVSSNITADIENKTLAAILEPFGSEALNHITRYWTPDDQNTRMIPLQGSLLYNRILWTGIALLITILSYLKFSFTQFLNPVTFFFKRSKTATASQGYAHAPLSALPVATQRFSIKDNWKQLFYLSGFEFVKMTKSTFFIIICALGMAMMFIVAQYIGSMYATETYPVTYQIIESVASIFQLFILILVVFFSGNIIWRDREQKMDELIGSIPVSNTVLFFSKYIALIYVVAVLLAVASITGMLIQVSMSYYHLEPLLYFKAGLRMLVGYTITAGVCMAIQVFSPNKYLGFFLSLLPVLFINIIFELLEWRNNLYIFNSSGPGMAYSDMNGYGHTVKSWLIFKSYWLSIVLLLCLLALMVLPRGKEKGLTARFRLSKSSFRPVHKIALALCILFAISAGGYIHYNTHILNRYVSPKQMEEEQAMFEKTYKRYERTPQLRIVSSYIDVAIQPYKREVQVEGFYYLKNKYNLPIDTLFVDYIGGEKTNYHYNTLQPLREARVIVDDKKSGVKMFVFDQPVLPGDSIRFNFNIYFKPKGFENRGTETEVVYNGTFFNNRVLPSIGYNPDSEISANRAREKYGLPHKPRMAAVDDSVALRDNYISRDADWIRFETVVSTSDDQIALAPGYLIKQWKKAGRNYFHYKMDSPILNFYAYLSARYEIKRDKWNDVNIEIYYHKGHEYNLERMIRSIKKSLEYYTHHFGPYQHRQVRILEFPRYASFAQSFPNTIPYSESVGFIARVDDKDKTKIDVPFYITAHEVAHQWWAHQVIGGNVQGSVLMSETMSQYAALMVMEKEYGYQAMKKFLKYEMDIYLKGRTLEAKKEVPLMLCENQGYIHYNKGSVIMYALKDYLGEEVLNSAVRTYLQKVKFQEPPYTNAIEFVHYLKEATPDSLQYIIHDMFETITIYENYVSDLSYKPTVDGKYKVRLAVGSAKFRSDSLGKNEQVPVADYIDVGVFARQQNNTAQSDPEKVLILQKVRMDKPEKTFEFIVNEKPYSAGIDPYYKLIDRTPDNNTFTFGSKPPKVNIESGRNKK